MKHKARYTVGGYDNKNQHHSLTESNHLTDIDMVKVGKAGRMFGLVRWEVYDNVYHSTLKNGVFIQTKTGVIEDDGRDASEGNQG